MAELEDSNSAAAEVARKSEALEFTQTAATAKHHLARNEHAFNIMNE